MPIAVFSVILETIHSAIKMLASRAVFTQGYIDDNPDPDPVGSGINFPASKPTYISA